jgi:ER lumen protein retaining receptor
MMATSKSGPQMVDQSTITAYLGMLAAVSLVYQSFHDIGLSTLLTLSMAIQCFGYACLMIKVFQTKNVAGISGRAIILQAVSYVLRLCSTTWLKGYIPVDATGDWLYQFLDVAALLMALQIIRCIFKSHRRTYQEESDTFNARTAVIVCVVLAVLVHPDLNARPVFDTLWTTGLYIDVIAMIPQLWMMSKTRGGIEALNCHFVGATAVSRCVNLIFWFHGFVELAPLDGSFNLAGWVIIMAHVIQSLLLCDFLFVYVKACMTNGLRAEMLPLGGYHDV